MRLAFAPIAAAMLLLQGCGPSDPRAERIENIQDMADAEAHDIAAEAGNEVTNMRTEAEQLATQADASNGFDAERLKTRAEALRKEARIVQRKAEAQARAVRDRARAEVSEIKAQ
jgi:hypothetical protein